MQVNVIRVINEPQRVLWVPLEAFLVEMGISGFLFFALALLYKAGVLDALFVITTTAIVIFSMHAFLMNKSASDPNIYKVWFCSRKTKTRAAASKSHMKGKRYISYSP